MSGYFGSEAHRALQARVVDSANWMQATPGACIGGRFMWCDDIDLLGWDTIERLLDRDGVFGFRMLPVDRVAAVSARLSERGFRVDRWNVFIGDRGTALVASNRVLHNPLPSGVSTGSFPRDSESDEMIAIQAFMSGSGVVPFPGIMLAGDLCPSTGVTLLDRDGKLVATAYSYLPHNGSSRYRAYAWGGLACVAEGYRGRALGAFVNALMVVKAFDELDAEWIYEMISETNLPSRRMAEACGLAIEPGLTTCIAIRAGEPRFTR